MRSCGFQPRTEPRWLASPSISGVSLDEALRIVLFEYQTSLYVARLRADPTALAHYRTEATTLAER